MKTSPQLFSRLLLLCVSFFAFAGASRLAAADESLGTQIFTVSVPSGLNIPELHQVLVNTLTGRHWTVQSESDSKVVGYLKHRGTEATVTFVYDGKEVSLYCVGYELNSSGEHKKPELPTRWLNNLREDVVKRMNRALSAK